MSFKEKFEPLLKIKKKISKFNYRHNIENEKKTKILLKEIVKDYKIYN